MTARASSAFARLVSAALARRGLGLRELCRRADLDPSFFSKVLAGKRNPPSEEDVLRRLAAALELDPVLVVVAAGRIPSDWDALGDDQDLLAAVHALATGRRAPARPAQPASLRRPAPVPAPVRDSPPHPASSQNRPRGLSEELL